jgi:hypothetical protein
VDKFKKIRYHNGKYELLTSWRGFNFNEDSFEPIENMVADVPEMVKAFLKKLNDPVARKVLREVF